MGSVKTEAAKKNVVALAVFALFRGVGASTFMTLFPLYMVELGYSMGEIGTIASLSTISSVVLLPFVGILIDSVGRKPITILTGLTVFFSLFIPAFTGSYGTLLLAYALYLFSFLAGQSSRSAMLADSVEKELGAAFAKVFLPFTVARTVVPFIAGYLAEVHGYTKVFFAFSFLTLIGTLFLAFYSVEPRREREKVNLTKELKNVFVLEKNLLGLCLFAIIDRFAWQLWSPLLNAHIKELGMSPFEVGILNSLTNATVSLTAYLSGGLIDRLGSLKGLALSEAFGILAVIPLSVTSSIIFAALSFVFIGISISLWVPAYNVAVAFSSSQQWRGKVYTKINTIRSAFSIPASYIGGFAYDTVASSAPFVASLILMMGNIILLKSKRLFGDMAK